MTAKPPNTLEAENVQLVGYHDLEGRPGFKLAMQESDGRFHLYMGHLWHSGWSILDVTDPTSPTLANFMEGPDNTWTLQVQAAEGLLITSLEETFPGWGGAEDDPFQEGAYIWDISSNPINPELLGHFHTGGKGTHRNHFDGGTYAYMTAQYDGFQGHALGIVDISDPRNPKEISRWWWPGQHIADGEKPEHEFYLHGPAYVREDYAYLSYGRVGMVILDVQDPSKPELVSRVDFGDFGSWLGCHSVVPVPDTHIVIANSEAIAEAGDEPHNYTVAVDVSEPASPRIISAFPTPAPSGGLPYRNYYEKGGRFGPHNQHHHQGHQSLYRSSSHIVMTYFNAGLRIFDIEDPYLPKEVGWYVPEDPSERKGPQPESTLVTQFEDVLVDRRGFIFVTDKNHGLFVLSYKGFE